MIAPPPYRHRNATTKDSLRRGVAGWFAHPRIQTHYYALCLDTKNITKSFWQRCPSQPARPFGHTRPKIVVEFGNPSLIVKYSKKSTCAAPLSWIRVPGEWISFSAATIENSSSPRAWNAHQIVLATLTYAGWRKLNSETRLPGARLGPG